jgi:hypothetical protein
MWDVNAWGGGEVRRDGNGKDIYKELILRE